jgi:hypothetical protein
MNAQKIIPGINKKGLSTIDRPLKTYNRVFLKFTCAGVVRIAAEAGVVIKILFNVKL